MGEMKVIGSCGHEIVGAIIFDSSDDSPIHYTSMKCPDCEVLNHE